MSGSEGRFRRGAWAAWGFAVAAIYGFLVVRPHLGEVLAKLGWG